jgi:hypothetical protein
MYRHERLLAPREGQRHSLTVGRTLAVRSFSSFSGTNFARLASSNAAFANSSSRGVLSLPFIG